MNEQAKHYQDKLNYEIDAWDLHEAQQSNQPTVVLDARGAAAFEREHIAGAISFPHRTMTVENTAKLDPAQLYVVYCDGIGCNASSAGALRMAQLGFRVRELIGGLEWWKQHGYPVEGREVAPASRAAAACEC